MEDIAAKVKEILARELKISADEVPDTATLNKFEGWDSLSHVSFVFALEEEFGFEITEEAIRTLTSIPDIVNFITVKSA